MPRLRQVSRRDAGDYIRRYYERLFGDRDPIAEPGTATGTPGNWWTVFALVPYIFEHATKQFGMFGMFSDHSLSELDAKIRELAILRTGYVQASQFVFSQHCKVARRAGVLENQIQAIPSWPVSADFSPLERAVLGYTDCLVLQGGRVPDALFEEVKRHLRDEDILELTYHVLSYNLHAVSCKALRLEFDDVPERIREVPAPR
jgi:alkylhydroperoxidase family enzyme